MRIYGLWEELSKIIFRKGTKVTVEPTTQTGSDKSINIPNMSPDSQDIILSAQSQTITNKTLGSTNNITGATAASFTNTGTVTLPTSGTLISTTDTGTITSAMIANGTIVNADISLTADIDRTKIVAGSVDHVLINNGTGALSSEAQLNKTRGGTGISSTATFPVSGVVVTRDATETLTNKTIDGDTNTIQDLALTSLKTTANINVFIQRDGIGAAIDSTKAVPAGVVVGTTDAQTLTNKTIDGDNNTVQDLALTSLKTTANLDVFLQRNGSGVVIDSTKAVPAGVVVGTTDIQTLTNKTLGSTNTLTGATVASFTNIGTVTLPTSGTLISSTDTGTVTSTMIADGTIINADINASAAIAQSKMAALTASKAAVTDVSGFVTTSATTSTEIGYIAGLTSAVQTQIDGKISDNILTTRGDILYRNSSNVTDNLPIGTVGQVLSTDGVDAFWSSPAGTGDVTAAANIGDNRLVRGDGGAKGIQQSGITIDDSNNVTGVVALTTTGLATIQSATVSSFTTGVVHAGVAGALTSSTIVNADVDAAAAIAGTKISPNFGSQTIQTTGIISSADGSSASPSITFTNDTDTGIYRPTTDTVGMVSGGNLRARVTTLTGNNTNLTPGFSIGSSAPTALNAFYFRATGGSGASDTVDALFENTVTTAGSYMGIVARSNATTGIFRAYTADAIYAGSTSSHPLILVTGGAERGKIDTSANWTIGISSSVSPTHNIYGNAAFWGDAVSAPVSMVGTAISGDTSSVLLLSRSGTNNGSEVYISFRDGGTSSSVGTQRSTLRTNAGNTAMEFTAISDVRLKQNIQTITNGLDKIKAIRPVTFEWKATGKGGPGFIAQEFAQVFPESVSIDGPEEENFYYMGTGDVLPYLIASIKELEVRIQALENR